jgi:hypothetical protein
MQTAWVGPELLTGAPPPPQKLTGKGERRKYFPCLECGREWGRPEHSRETSIRLDEDIRDGHGVSGRGGVGKSEQGRVEWKDEMLSGEESYIR